MMDLDAIRARDARALSRGGRIPKSETDDTFARRAADRRALLTALDEANAECAQARAEVDRLMAELDAALEVEEGLGDIIKHEDAREKRADAVIEAARLRRNVVLYRQPGFTDGEWVAVPHSDFDALRAALAEYEEVTG